MALVEEMLTDGGVKAVASLLRILVVCAVLGTAAVVGGTASITSSVKVLTIQLKNLNDRVVRLENKADDN